jgi:hypothetical protein
MQRRRQDYMTGTRLMRRLARRSTADPRAHPVRLHAAIVPLATLGLGLMPAATYADSVAPTLTVPTAVTVVGSRHATLRVEIHDGGGAFSLCDWLTCDAEVGVFVYDSSGHQVGIDAAFNSVDDRFLAADLVVPVTLSPLVNPLPSGTYSVKVTTLAADNLNTTEGGAPPAATTATATFSLNHVPATRLSLGRTVSTYKDHGWKIIGVLKKDGRLWAGAKVTIQVKVSPLGWSKMASKTTGKKGQVSFTSTPDLGSGRWPARLLATGPYGETIVSRAFVLYRR